MFVSTKCFSSSLLTTSGNFHLDHLCLHRRIHHHHTFCVFFTSRYEYVLASYMKNTYVCVPSAFWLFYHLLGWEFKGVDYRKEGITACHPVFLPLTNKQRDRCNNKATKNAPTMQQQSLLSHQFILKNDDKK